MEAPRVHIWHRCSSCGMRPIVGPRFHCETCAVGPENDFCEACYAELREGRIRHVAPRSLPAPTSHRFTSSSGEPAQTFDAWLTLDAQAHSAPEVPNRFLTRPEFQTIRGSSFGGYAFVIRYRQESRLITALH